MSQESWNHFQATNVGSPTKMESGMRVDLHSRSIGAIAFRSPCRATVPVLLILMTCLSCSTPPAEMLEPRYGPAFSLSDPLPQRDDGQSAHRTLHAQPALRQDQHKFRPFPKIASVHPPPAGASAPRHASEKPKQSSLSDAQKNQLFQEFLEWRKLQTEVP